MLTWTKPAWVRLFFFMGVFLMLFMGYGPSTATPFITAAPGNNQEAFCGPMDIVIAIDDTGSMESAIANIKAGIKDLIAEIDTASDGDLRLGLVTFKDDVTIRNELAPDNADAVITNIQSLFANGGEGSPEASDEALRVIINGNDDFAASWRPEARKIIVLVTDAEPGGLDDLYEEGVDDVNAHNRALEAAAKGIFIVPVFVPTMTDWSNPELARPVMQDYAETTGGIYRETASDGSGTLDAIKSLLETCAFRPDVWIKDHVADVGHEPSNVAPIWNSPDIKVCMGDEECDTHQKVVFGYPETYIYVTLRNNGPNTESPPQGATGDLHLYFSSLGGASQWNPSAPDGGPVSGDWTWINARYDISIAPGERERTVRIPWPVDKIPAPGHYCMLARWVSDTDPMTFPETVHTVEKTKNNNNIAWKNFDVIQAPRGTPINRQYVVRPIGQQNSDLIIESTPPFPGTIELRPGNLADPRTVQGEGIVRRGEQSVIIDRDGGRLVNLQPDTDGDEVEFIFTPDASAKPGKVIVDVFQEANLPPVQDVGGTRFEIVILPEDAPPVAPIAAIDAVADGTAIIWQHEKPNQIYEVLRSDRDNFVPGDPDVTVIAEVEPDGNDGTEALRFIDVDAPIGAEAPFYMVRSKNEDDEAANSNIVTLRNSPPVPPLPFNVFGKVVSPGEPVPDGTVIHAIINGRIVASSPIFTSTRGSGRYTLTVPGDIPDTEAIEGGQPGDIVRVVVETTEGPLSAVTTWEEGDLVRLDLGGTDPTPGLLVEPTFATCPPDSELLEHVSGYVRRDKESGQSRTYELTLPEETQVVVVGYAQEGHPESCPDGRNCGQSQLHEEFNVTINGDRVGTYYDQTAGDAWFPVGPWRTEKSLPAGTLTVKVDHLLTGTSAESVSFKLSVCAVDISALPTATPTATERPAIEPTATERPIQPTAEPTATPTVTERPIQPTAEPTATPTVTERPIQPTAEPTATPTVTERPVQPTAEPTVTERPVQPDASAVITRQGGELETESMMVTFPAGAVNEDLIVTYSSLPLPANALVSFSLKAETMEQPEQPVTHFRKPITIMAHYTDAQAQVLNVAEEDLVLAYFDEVRNKWVQVQTDQVNTEDNLVIATLDHFTDFAVMPRSAVAQPGGESRVYLPMISQ